MEIIKPKSLKKGDTIGVFTPSSPSYIHNEEMFLNAKKSMEALGFNVKFGDLTERRTSQGYRSAGPKARAREFMELIEDDGVHALMSTIGGMNSNSMIPYLDFELIRKKRKIVCGYSDVTSLHMSILSYSGLKTFYGAAFMPTFGEYPNGALDSLESFLKAATNTSSNERQIFPFKKWSNHFREWSNGDWKNLDRKWNENLGWKVLNEGQADGEFLLTNLNTLTSACGTPYFPNIEGKILLLEEMAAPYSRLERNLTQMKLCGVFDQIKGLIFGKPELENNEGAPFNIEDLLIEIVGKRDYPIITEFDCSHTVPLHTIGQLCPISVEAKKDYEVKFLIKDSFVD